MKIINTKTGEVVATVSAPYAYEVAQSLRCKHRDQDFQVIQ